MTVWVSDAHRPSVRYPDRKVEATVDYRILCDYDSLSVAAAAIIAQQLRQKPDSAIAMATGGTPLGTYRELIRLHREEGLDFSQVTTFNLDEYRGVAPDHPASFVRFLHDHLYGHVNVTPTLMHMLDAATAATDAVAACRAYDAQLAAHGALDLVLLGIGLNGHIGFNEPKPQLMAETHIEDLLPETVASEAKRFRPGEPTPTQAIAMGVGPIMRARRVILLANGAAKADIIRQTVRGPIVTTVPASLLQLHPNALILLDAAAAGGLTD